MGAMEVMEVRVATSSFTSLTLLTFPTRVTIDRFFITGSVGSYRLRVDHMGLLKTSELPCSLLPW